MSFDVGVDWGSYSHISGNAADTPTILSQLWGETPGEALRHLWWSFTDEGRPQPITPVVLYALMGVLDDPRLDALWDVPTGEHEAWEETTLRSEILHTFVTASTHARIHAHHYHIPGLVVSAEEQELIAQVRAGHHQEHAGTNWYEYCEKVLVHQMLQALHAIAPEVCAQLGALTHHPDFLTRVRSQEALMHWSRLGGEALAEQAGVHLGALARDTQLPVMLRASSVLSLRDLPGDVSDLLEAELPLQVAASLHPSLRENPAGQHLLRETIRTYEMHPWMLPWEKLLGSGGLQMTLQDALHENVEPDVQTFPATTPLSTGTPDVPFDLPKDLPADLTMLQKSSWRAWQAWEGPLRSAFLQPYDPEMGLSGPQHVLLLTMSDVEALWDYQPEHIQETLHVLGLPTTWDHFRNVALNG